MYKVKRFSKLQDYTRSALIGGAFGGLIPPSSSSRLTGMAVGSLAGLGAQYLHDRNKKKLGINNLSNKNNIEEYKKKHQNEMINVLYPMRSSESKYPGIKSIGGLPEEYYVMSNIGRKLYKSNLKPTWGDGDEYSGVILADLDDINNQIINGSDTRYIYLFSLSVHGDSSITYDPSTRKFYDETDKIKEVRNLKRHLLNDMNNQIEHYKSIDYLDKWEVDEVLRWYKEIVRLIQSSNL